MSERHFGTVGGAGRPSTDWSRSPLAICASIVSRLRSAVSGATVETLPFRRNNSLYSATVMSCAEIVWFPPTILNQRPHRWHWTRSPS